MNSIARLLSFLTVIILTGAPVDSVIARGGGGGGFAATGGGTHFAFRGNFGSIHGRAQGSVGTVNKQVNKHRPFVDTTRRAFVGKHGGASTVFPFGMWDGGWSYPAETIIAPLTVPGTQPVFAPPMPESIPPCREIQAGVTVMRGKSCRA